ncbi:MAG TPA: 2-oxoglutarate dehydrogenase complex dihydrolipoyllysine-residue succinyltransferase [Vicinamibacteria bacterium]|jgi:2-oxoglutarate dehydrogenase E2 component (dihydrolipoamide succinyltransferase)
MATEIKVPELGESVNEARVGRWLKKKGEHVRRGDAVVALETDKVDLEVGAEEEGVLSSIEHDEGADVRVGDVLGLIEPGEEPSAEKDQKTEQVQKEAAKEEAEADTEAEETQAEGEVEEAPAEAQAHEGEPSGNGQRSERGKSSPKRFAPARAQGKKEPPATMKATAAGAAEHATPTAKRMAEESDVALDAMTGSGDRGRIVKRDVERFLANRDAASSTDGDAEAERREERIPMSARRRTIARRLVEAQRTAAMLTTFNEIDMGAVQELRRRYVDTYEQEHGTRLGIVSFFIKAAIGALKQYPRLNAEIDGDEMVLKHYYDIGVAVGASEGLVVPVIRDADRKSMIELEKSIEDLARRAEDNELTIQDLQGGTFTISNGGVFGSLLSTPILNPPQVGILGLHKIEERPYVVDGEIRVRPLMYVALSYDHRIVDGREAVQFLARIKTLLENPGRLIIEA